MIVEAAITKINEFWKISRGQADWVAVCNIDEFFWHCDLNWYLRECQKRGITFLESKGYQMVSYKFAERNDDLIHTHRRGCRFQKFDKPCFFFNPNAITETKFARGRHSCNPKGSWRDPNAMRSFSCTTSISVRNMLKLVTRSLARDEGPSM